MFLGNVFVFPNVGNIFMSYSTLIVEFIYISKHVLNSITLTQQQFPPLDKQYRNQNRDNIEVRQKFDSNLP